MSWLAEICVKRPIFALMMIAALLVGGITAFPQLGVDRFPSMDLPTIFVRTTYPGAASTEVESEVTLPIEDAVATVAGIDELRSLDPNREVSPNFLNYVVLTDDGRTAVGIIAAENASSITLRRGEGKEETILRQNIEEITSSGQSLMPEGLEKDISPQEMADLIVFLLAKPDKTASP